MKRAAIYLFFDNQGIVDRYVTYLLKEIRKVSDYIVIVCNGKINKEGRCELIEHSDDFFCRENIGFDVWAYHDAIEYIGWEELYKYDELMIVNHTFFGPFYPLEQVFEKMADSDCDWWGMQRRYEDKALKQFGGRPTYHGYMPEFTLSNFWVIRSKLLHSYEFKKYWNSLPPIKDYIDACIYHEPVFTKKMCDAGYTFDTVDGESQRNLCPSPTVQAAYQQIAELNVPICRRRVFINPVSEFYNWEKCDDALKVLEYIDKNTDYDVSMIWENILRTSNQFDIKNRLCLNYTLSKIGNQYSKQAEQTLKSAVVFHAFYDDIFDKYLKYLSNFPIGTDIYITVISEEAKNIFAEKISELEQTHNVSFIIVENRGRDVSALVVGARDVVLSEKYDLVCFMHDKKAAGANSKWECIGNAFSDTCFDNTAISLSYVENVISLFETDKNLGIAVPPAPSHATYYKAIGGRWVNNFKNTKELLSKLDCMVPLDEKKPPVAAYGTVFWFRTKALKPLFEYDWKYNDFQEEPADSDGTLMHAIERAYSLIAQSQKYYPAIIMNEDYARQELMYMTALSQKYICLSQQYSGNAWNADHQIARLEEVLKCKMSSPVQEQKLEPAKAQKKGKGSKSGFKQTAKRIIPHSIWETLRRLKCRLVGEKYYRL